MDMKRIVSLRLTIFVLFFMITGMANAQHGSSDSTVAKVSNSAEINWMSFEEAWAKNKVEPRRMMIDFWTDWCGWCKRMDATTFKDSLIVDYVNKNFYAVSFDAEQKEDVVVEDRTYKFVASGRRGYHELAAELMQGKMSYPTYVFLNDKGQILTPVPGYKAAKDFLPILEFLSQYDVDNPSNWEDFLKSYNSPYEQP